MVEKGMFYVLFLTFLHFNQNLMPFLEQPINFFTNFAKEDKSTRQSESCLSLRSFAISSHKS